VLYYAGTYLQHCYTLGLYHIIITFALNICFFEIRPPTAVVMLLISFLFEDDKDDDISPQWWRVNTHRRLFGGRDLGMRAYRICQTPRSYVCIIRSQPSVRNSGLQSYYTRGVYVSYIVLCVLVCTSRTRAQVICFGKPISVLADDGDNNNAFTVGRVIFYENSGSARFPRIRPSRSKTLPNFLREPFHRKNIGYIIPIY